jgi:pimeloyl-ACP methyl ester carboxylesterase
MHSAESVSIAVRVALCLSCIVSGSALATDALNVSQTSASETSSSFPGTRSTWNGFARYDFTVDEKPVMVIVPDQAAPGKPWVWHGEFFGHRPVPDVALLGRGFHIVAMQIPDLFGGPPAVSHWNTLYRQLTTQYKLSTKPALVGVSRGGLYCYNWAAQNPNCVSCIYGDAPVCDLKSWPLGMGKGTGNSGEVPKLLKVYGVDTVEQLLQKAVSPIDQLKPMADAGVPLLHVYGDADQGVPWDENTGIVAERYRQLGGMITLISKPGVGHVHGLEDSTPIIEFISRNAVFVRNQDQLNP